MNNIKSKPFLTLTLLISLHVLGCQSAPKRNSSVFRMGYSVSETGIMASIGNVSGVDLLVDVPIHGIGFDLEYVTSNGEIKLLNGLGHIHMHPIYSLHLMSSARFKPDGSIDGFGPDSIIFLSLPTPSDFKTMRRIECYVKFVKFSELREIRNMKDLGEILNDNGVYLCIITPGATDTDGAEDEDGLPALPINPIRDASMRGYIRR